MLQTQVQIPALEAFLLCNPELGSECTPGMGSECQILQQQNEHKEAHLSVLFEGFRGMFYTSSSTRGEYRQVFSQCSWILSSS